MTKCPLVYTAPERETDREKGYNIGVASPAHKPVSGIKQQHRQRAYAAEATGLILMAVVLLVLTIVRYWSYINWSMR